jgi:hypothetical protein
MCVCVCTHTHIHNTYIQMKLIFFGLHLTQNLQWDGNIKELRSKLSKVIGHPLNTQVLNILKSMYFANLHLHLRYSSFFW